MAEPIFKERPETSKGFKPGDMVVVSGISSFYRRRNHKHFVEDSRGKTACVESIQQYGCWVRLEGYDKPTYFFNSELVQLFNNLLGANIAPTFIEKEVTTP